MKKFKKLLILIICIIITASIISYFYVKSVGNEENEIYSIKEKEISLYEEEYREYQGIKLLEYDNSNKDYAEIYFISYDYTTEPGIYYTVEITDEQGKSLIIEDEGETKIIGGMVTSVRIEKLGLNDKFNFAIYEIIESTKSIENSVEVEINLSTDLNLKEKISQDDIKDGKIGNVNFKYIDSEYVYFGSNLHYYSKIYSSENCSIPVKVQYGNTLISEEHISLSAGKNVNNLSLNEAFESLKLINKNMGQYGLPDVFGLDIWDKQKEEHIETIVIDFEQMINLCKGVTIEKDGNKYSLKDFYDENMVCLMAKDEEVTLGNGVKAIKYHYEYDNYVDYSESRYLFADDDYIYNLTIPENERTNDIINEFINSLKLGR